MEANLNNIRQMFASYAKYLTPMVWADMDAVIRFEFSRLFNIRGKGRYMWHVHDGWYVTLYDHYPKALATLPELDELAKRLDNSGYHVMIIRGMNMSGREEVTYVIRMDALFFFYDNASDFATETLPYFLTVFESLYGDKHDYDTKQDD